MEIGTRRFTTGVALLITLAAISCASCTRIGPGYAGIVVSQAGTNRGVEDTPATVGWVFYNPFLTNVYEYPTFVRTAVWTKNPNEGKNVNEELTFTNADQMQISVDVSLAFHLIFEKVPYFYVKFRSDDLDQFTHGILRNLARDEFTKYGGKYNISQIMGDNAAFIADVRTNLQTQLTPFGVQLDQFGIIGAPRPPDAVIEAINAKVHATQLAQQKQNELVQVEADMNKERSKTDTYARNTLVMAEAQATANRKIADSLSPNLIELKRLEKWNGVNSLVVSSSGSLPIVNVK